MSRLLILALFCTSAIACTKASSPHTITLARTPVEVSQPAPAAAPVVAQPAPASETTQLRDRLAIARAENLARLQAYAAAGAFPKNKVTAGLLNVFRDDEGHLCAVANLINMDGHTTLIDETAQGDNFIVLANVTSGPLLDWILDSGFTQEEIGMIQVPYMGRIDQPIEAPAQEAIIAAQMQQAETNRVRNALLQVHQSLSANTIASLDLAVERATQGVAIAQVSPQRFSQPPR
tara:strand:+ start:40581 stop:41282 length:702 start_codon:yes stop_codon:yes gene_type:complete